MDILLILQARTGSTRLPKKMIKPFHGELTILQIILRNLKKRFDANQICLATTTLERDDVLCNTAEKEGVLTFRGSENNVLERFIQCAEMHNAHTLVRICADNPFLLPDFIPPLLNQLKKTKLDYCSFQWPDKTPVMKSHIGLFAECMTLNFLKQIYKKTKDPLYLEHVTNYVYEHAEEFKVDFLSLPTEIKNKPHFRLTVDTAEDFLLTQEIHSQLNPNSFAIDELIRVIESDYKYIHHMKENIIRNAK